MNILKLLIMFSILFFVVSLIMIISISISKKARKRQDHINKLVMDNYQDQMYDYLVNSNFHTSLIPREKYTGAFEYILLNFSYIINGDIININIKKYAEQYFTEYYRVALKKTKWSNRVNALNGIAQFKMSTLTEEVHDLFHKKEIREDPILCALILKIIFQQEDKLFLRLIKQYDIELTSSQYRELCEHLDDIQWDYLIGKFDQLGYEFKLSIIDSISIFKKNDYILFLETYLTKTCPKERELIKQKIEQKLISVRFKSVNELQSELPAVMKMEKLKMNDLEKQIKWLNAELNKLNELIIRGLKTLSTISRSINDELLKEYMFSSIWQEKLMIIRLIGNARIHDHFDYVVNSLSDTNYLIRKEAAQNLAKLSINKQQILEVYESLNEDNAKDELSKFL